MRQCDRGARQQAIRRGFTVDCDDDRRVTDNHAKRHVGQPFWQARGEGDVAAEVAHPAESGNAVHPGAGQRRDVQAGLDVGVQVVQIGEHRLAHQVVGEVEVADLGGDDRLATRGQWESRTVSG